MQALCTVVCVTTDETQWQTNDSPATWLKERLVPELNRMGQDVCYDIKVMSVDVDEGFWQVASFLDESLALLLPLLSLLQITPLPRLIFLADGIGGLLIKQLLVAASEGDTQARLLVESTVGCIFIGVPHRAESSAEYARILAQRAERTLPDLVLATPYLMALNRLFFDLLQNSHHVALLSIGGSEATVRYRRAFAELT